MLAECYEMSTDKDRRGDVTYRINATLGRKIRDSYSQEANEVIEAIMMELIVRHDTGNLSDNSMDQYYRPEFAMVTQLGERPPKPKYMVVIAEMLHWSEFSKNADSIRYSLVKILEQYGTPECHDLLENYYSEQYKLKIQELRALRKQQRLNLEQLKLRNPA